MNNQITALCQELDMPHEISAEAASVDISQISRHIDTLISPEINDEVYKTIAADIGEDPRGIRTLALHLTAALKSRELYDQRGINNAIFIDTMKCFSRFVREYTAQYDHYGFNTGFWSWRQLSLKLFRLGVLEFETTEREGKKVLSVHIPSDAVMTKEALACSYKWAAEFFNNYEYEYIYCDTWLLSPALKDMLPEGSRILNFMADYEILSTAPDAKDFMTRVYVKEYPDYASLPENTSLQRAVKKHLLAGGKVGNAFGRYRPSYK